MIVLEKFEAEVCDDSPSWVALRTIAPLECCSWARLGRQHAARRADDPQTRWLIDPAVFQGDKGPTVVQLPSQHMLVVLPVLQATIAENRQLFVVAELPGDRAETVAQLAELAWTNALLLRKTAMQEHQLNQYADQVLHDFAEIDWMQKLVAQLKLCSLSNSLQETALGLLTPLREIIGAESIAFIPADNCRPGGLPLNEGQPTSCTWISKSKFSNGLIGRLLQRYADQASEQVVVKNRTVAWSDSAQFAELSGFMMASVSRRGHLSGWIVALNRIASCESRQAIQFGMNSSHTQLEFSTSEAGLLAVASSVLATHDHNVRLLQSNVNLSLSMIQALANTVDAKDDYTRGHSDRVARMARQLGHVLGLSERECQQLLLTGLLHDIGKIGVPDAVLQKPGKLTDQEFDIIKQHPVLGHEIIAPVRELQFALPGVLHHHEAYSGRGYPHGLAGEEIPYIARILAIVDAYDAMTSDRPYRSGMQFETAESIIADGAGDYWDPAMVKVFLANIDVFRGICAERSQRSDSIKLVASDPSALTDLSSGSCFYPHSECEPGRERSSLASLAGASAPLVPSVAEVGISTGAGMPAANAH